MIGQDTTAPMFKPRVIRPCFVAVASSPLRSASRAYETNIILPTQKGHMINNTKKKGLSEI